MLQYVQTKLVLQRYFGVIMKELSSQHRYASYKLSLPAVCKSNERCIPQSLIAKRLDSKLATLLTETTNSDEDSSITDMTSSMVCNEIICAFEIFVE